MRLLAAIIRRTKYFFSNILIIFLGIFIKRDINIIVVGGWFGQKFADNSRYLYQYLFLNKEKYRLEKVIWVTNDQGDYNQLSLLGYDVCMMYSLKSYYYHLKSGIHIICNSYTTDIVGLLSMCATKIQLWHGIGVKCINYSNKNIRETLLDKIKNSLTHNEFYNKFFTPGDWSNCFWLSGSNLDTEWLVNCLNIKKNKIIETAYPRNCECLELLANEKNIINILKKHDKVIMYFPTFRDDYSQYIHPLSDIRILEFLEANDILWVEKLHSYADQCMHNEDTLSKNILYLNHNFDINTIFDYGTILVTDYSTVVYDFILKFKKIVHYIPDYYYYKNVDRGFLIDFNSFFPTEKTYNTIELKKALESMLAIKEFAPDVLRRYKEINRIKWNEHIAEYSLIVSDVFKTIGMHKETDYEN